MVRDSFHRMTLASHVFLMWLAFAKSNQSREAPKRVISVGDLHGDYNNTVVILSALGVIGVDGRWTGGDTVLVQTGDVVDRGPDSFKIYRLLHRLQDEAPSAGGRVILLLGNHELMNLAGDFRYVADADCEELGAFGCHKPKPGYKASFQSSGVLGQALLQRHQAAALVEDTPGSGNALLFVHAGILPEIAEGLGKIGSDAAKALNANVLNELHGRQSSLPTLLGDEGPFWSRRLALARDSSVCEDVRRSLKVFQARRMIVGHTPQTSGHVGVRCGGHLVLADTLISSAYTGVSHKSALVIPNLADGEVYATYPTEADLEKNLMPKFHVL